MSYNRRQADIEHNLRSAKDALRDLIDAATDALDKLDNDKRTSNDAGTTTFPYYYPSERFGNFHLADPALRAERHLAAALTIFRESL